MNFFAPDHTHSGVDPRKNWGTGPRSEGPTAGVGFVEWAESPLPISQRQCDNDNGKQYEYVYITNNQPDTKSNPNPTTKQHTIANIQLNIVTWPIRIQRNSYMRQCCCIVCTNFGCLCHTNSASEPGGSCKLTATRKVRHTVFLAFTYPGAEMDGLF